MRAWLFAHLYLIAWRLHHSARQLTDLSRARFGDRFSESTAAKAGQRLHVLFNVHPVRCFQKPSALMRVTGLVQRTLLALL